MDNFAISPPLSNRMSLSLYLRIKEGSEKPLRALLTVDISKEDDTDFPTVSMYSVSVSSISNPCHQRSLDFFRKPSKKYLTISSYANNNGHSNLYFG
jgi:hypothetical protein